MPRNNAAKPQHLTVADVTKRASRFWSDRPINAAAVNSKMQTWTIEIAHVGTAQWVLCKSAMGWVADLHVGAAIFRLRPTAGAPGCQLPGNRKIFTVEVP